jgi:hypothetical protein
MNNDFIKDLKVGDKVWVGDSNFPHREGIQTIVRMTATMIFLLRHGCTAPTEFDRYRRTGRYPGWQVSNLMFKNRIIEVATSEECIAFDKELVERARSNAALLAKREDRNKRRETLAAMFNDAAVFTNDDGETWTVSFSGLTEQQVKVLAVRQHLQVVVEEPGKMLTAPDHAAGEVIKCGDLNAENLKTIFKDGVRVGDE